MVTKKYVTVGLVLAAVVAIGLIFFVDWEARAVKKQLRSLAKEMTWVLADNELTVATRIKHVQEKISETCQVEIPSYKISQSVSKKDVQAYLMMVRGYYRNLSVEFEDLKVEFIQLPQARAVTTAYVKAYAPDGQRDDQVLALEFNLQKIDKKWQITAAKEMQILERQ